LPAHKKKKEKKESDKDNQQERGYEIKEQHEYVSMIYDAFLCPYSPSF